MVAQEKSPLAGRVNLGRLGKNVDDWESILLVNGHEHPRHEWKVEVHVALVALTEIGRSVFRPLVGFGQKETALELRVDAGAKLFQEGMRLRQILAIRTLLLVEVGDGIQTQPVNAKAEPKIDDLEERFLHCRILEIQVRLMGVEPMPIVGIGDSIPRPIRNFEVLENDSSFWISFRRFGPHIEIALDRPGRRAPRPLKPWVLVGRVIENELRDDADAAPVCFS